ncbi:MAG: type II toxin-antitoxin system HicA family toxin [Segetibacter sp.]
MRTTNFIKYLILNNCKLLREGSNHSIFQNQLNKKISSVPRHKEVKNNLVRKICKDLEILPPSNFQ